LLSQTSSDVVVPGNIKSDASMRFHEEVIGVDKGMDDSD
jgi:hypothetical protein